MQYITLAFLFSHECESYFRIRNTKVQRSENNLNVALRSLVLAIPRGKQFGGDDEKIRSYTSLNL